MDASNWDSFCALTEDEQATLIERGLQAAINERGADYVYVDPDGRKAGGTCAATCVYVDRNAEPACPSCLVGYVLHGLGMPLDTMDTAGGVGHWLTYRPQWIKMRGLLMLAAAQAVQDEGGTWGVAKQAAVCVSHAYGTRLQEDERRRVVMVMANDIARAAQ